MTSAPSNSTPLPSTPIHRTPSDATTTPAAAPAADRTVTPKNPQALLQPAVPSFAAKLFERSNRDLVREVRKERQEWLSLLRFLKDRNKNLTYFPGVFVTDSSLLNGDFPLYDLIAAGRDSNSFDLYAGGPLGIRPEDLAPGRYLKEQATTFLEKDDDLSDDGRKDAEIRINAVTLHVSLSTDRVSIVLWNWFEPEPFFAKDFQRSQALVRMEDPSYPDRWTLNPNLLSILNVTIAGHLKGFSFDEAIASLEPLSTEEASDWKRSIVYGAERPEGWTRSELRGARRSWRRLLRPMKTAHLDARAVNDDIDRADGRHLLLHESTALEVTRRVMRRNRFEPIEVHGLLDGIFLETRGRVRSHRLARDPDVSSPLTSWQRDRYGNVILPISGRDLQNGRSSVVGFHVVPRLPLENNEQKQGASVVLGVDLSRFGLKDYPKLLTVPVLTPLLPSSTERTYAVYSTLPPERGGKDRIASLFEVIRETAAATERSFGFEPGQKVKNIFFVPSLHENASVQAANPETLFFWEEILPSLLEGNAAHVVRHETHHSLDIQYGFSLHPAFRSFHERLTASDDTELFSAVNESRFLDLPGGHAGDDPQEFFASLVNTLGAPAWDGKVDEMTPRVRGLYHYALKTLRAAFLARHAEIKGTPVFRTLENRIASLEKRDDFTRASLDTLVLTPIPELFRKGNRSVRPIESWDFRKAVLRSRRPVGVFVYGHREDATRHLPNVDLTKRIGPARVVAMDIEDTKAWSEHFGGTVQSGRLYVFQNGRLTGSVDVIEESLRKERRGDLVGKEEPVVGQ